MTAPSSLWSPADGASAPALPERVRLFALNATADLGAAIARALDRPLARHEERGFEDGEHKARPLEGVGETDCYVIQSLHGGPDESVNDKLCRLLFFIGALKDAGAARVTAVTPYLCYARKDRRTKPFDPVITRYVAALFEAVGTDRLVTLEVHNPPAFENAFRCRAVTLPAAPLFVNYALRFAGEPLCVLSPDPGGAKRAELFRETLETKVGRPVGKAFADKHRSAGVVTGDLLVGEVAGATVLLIDDLISTGGTLVRAARAARQAGARRVIALAAHGLFMPGAAEALADDAVERVVVTDAVPPFRLEGLGVADKVEILPSAPLFAAAIARLAAGAPLTDLLAY